MQEWISRHLPHTSLLWFKISKGIEFKEISLTLSSSQLSVSDPTFSFNAPFLRPNTVQSFCRFVTKNYSISIAVPPLFPVIIATNLMLRGPLVESMSLDWKVVGSNPAPVVRFFFIQD